MWFHTWALVKASEGTVRLFECGGDSAVCRCVTHSLHGAEESADSTLSVSTLVALVGVSLDSERCLGAETNLLATAIGQFWQQRAEVGW